MTAAEYIEAVHHIGLDNHNFCKLIGQQPRAGRNWSAGRRRIPQGVIALLRLMISHGLNRDNLREALTDR